MRRNDAVRSTAILMLALILAGCSAVGSSQAPVSPSVTSGGTDQATASVAVDPQRYAADPRLAACLATNVPADPMRTLADVLYAFPLPAADQYRSHLAIGFQADLAASSAPALVVVAKGLADLDIIRPAPLPGSSTPSPIPSAQLTQHAVCVGIAGRTEPVLLGNVNDADVAVPPASEAPGPTARLAATVGVGTQSLQSLTWDAARGVLWAVIADGNGGSLARIDPTGAVQRWPLPNGPTIQPLPTIQAGLQQQPMSAAQYGSVASDVAVDGQGMVWIAAGLALVVFDPATDQTRMYVFPQDPAPYDARDPGYWISAIAPDADGVLVVRNNLRQLVHVDDTLQVTSVATLPTAYAGSFSLAETAGRIFVGSARTDQAGAASVGIFTTAGVQTGQVSIDPLVATGLHLTHALQVAAAQRVAVLPYSIGTGPTPLISKDGQVVGQASFPLEAPWQGGGGPELLLTTDWSSHIWYANAWSSRLLEVDQAPELIP